MNEKTKTLIVIGIIAVVGGTLIYVALDRVNQFNNALTGSGQSAEDRILSGEFDDIARQSCTDSYTSFGLEPTEGQITLCMNMAKGLVIQNLK
jgi:hypothetical protein